ncbi:hypothetical protein HDZ31DRAFT_44226 [Schizophyllum fasciatum]
MPREDLAPARRRYLDKTRSSSVSAFYATYAKDWEKLSRSEVNSLVDHLREKSIILADGQWASLPTPERRGWHWTKAEDAHFKGLETIFKDVAAVAEALFPEKYKRTERTTKFMCRPRKTVGSDVVESSHRVDAIAIRRTPSYPGNALKAGPQDGSAHNATVRLRRTGPFKYIADVLVTGEHKLDNTAKDRRDDDEKTYHHASHALYNDAARTAVFAYTIEGTKMRLWCHTRSHTCVTKSFHIHEKHDKLVQFILFATYASLPQLGVDPTVRRIVDDKGRLQYQFTVCNPETAVTQTYETDRIIYEASAADLYSRSMRVFEVRQILGSPRAHKRSLAVMPNVLRDFWVRDNTPLESKIQSGISRALQAVGAWDDVKDHFMTIVVDDIVTVPLSEMTCTDVPAPYDRAERCQLVDDAEPGRKRPRKSQVPPHEKKHVRTVYEQLCLDLYKVDDPAIFFYALSQIVKILRYLKRAGYIHGDVSPGNFLMYFLKGRNPGSTVGTKREDWITIVSDLEYARPYFGGSVHDPITGTPYHVAAEVQTRSYAFMPMAGAEKSHLSDVLDHFAFNFYHDLESTIWMALAFVFRYMPRGKIDEKVMGRDIPEVLQEHARDMFLPNVEGAWSRWQYITQTRRVQKVTTVLETVYANTPIVRLPDLIADLRQAYTDLEGSGDIPGVQLQNGRKAFDLGLFKDEVYRTCEAVFRDISDHYASLDRPEIFVSVPDPPPPQYAPLSSPPPEESTAASTAVSADDESDPGESNDGKGSDDANDSAETEEEGAEDVSDCDDSDDQEDRTGGIKTEDELEEGYEKQESVGPSSPVVTAEADVESAAAETSAPGKRKCAVDQPVEAPASRLKRSRKTEIPSTRQSGRIRQMRKNE